MSTAQLHPKVWSAAASLWDDGHYQLAVGNAYQAVMGHLWTRVDREIDGAPLVEQAFTMKPPQPGRLCLRLSDETNAELFKDLQVRSTWVGHASRSSAILLSMVT